MSDTLQSVLVLLILAAAGGYVMRRSWQTLKGRTSGGCHGCSSCVTSPPTVVPLASVRIPPSAEGPES